MPATQPRFAAPWSRSLKFISLVATALLVGIFIAQWRSATAGDRIPWPALTVLPLPPLILLGAALFTVRGYRLVGAQLQVQRLLWVTRIPLDGLLSAWHSPDALARSVRLFGNNGMFAITGLYSNALLGRYRAFATDPRRAVVLELPGRVVVISPEVPRVFLAALRQQYPQAEYPAGAPRP